MTRKTCGDVPVEIYHGVPVGWSKSEILSEYKLLGGIEMSWVSEATEPGAPSWLPDRFNWLQYRETLRALPGLIRSGDLAAIELAIRYIELNYFGSYSGFLRATLSRALKSTILTKGQKVRLITHFDELKRRGECLQEFKEYNRLIKVLEKQNNV